jgi:hypothetical protein
MNCVLLISAGIGRELDEGSNGESVDEGELIRSLEQITRDGRVPEGE